MTDRRAPLTYADAGVDIAAGAALVDRIAPRAAATKRTGVLGGLGGFGALFDLRAAGFEDPILVAATDGVGTKLRIAIDTGRLETVGVDLVAMCVNDLVCQGAEPLFFLDYFATGRLSVDSAAAVIDGVAEGCRRAGCALIGGETAEMPGMYPPGDFDIAGFAVGAAERGALLPRAAQPGDILLALPSDGVHSNGYSLVRRAVEQTGLRWSDPAPFANAPLGEALLTPTRIYVPACLAAIRSGGVRALAHITGGGLTENLPRVLPEKFGAEIDLGRLPRLPVFDWLRDVAGLSDAEALTTFNCGAGMILVVEPDRVADVTAALAAAGEAPVEIGRVAEGEGVRYSGAL